MHKLYKYLTYIILITYPIMKFYDIGGVKLNLSIADALLPIYFLLLIFNYKNLSVKKNFPHVLCFFTYFTIFLASNIFNLSSSVNSAGISGMLSEGVKIVTCGAYFFIAYNGFDNEKDFKFFSVAWLIGLWIFMIYGLIDSPMRFIGTFNDPNGAGSFLTFSCFVVFILIFKYEKPMIRVFLCVTQAVLITCTILTQSRGTLVGIAVGLAFFLVFFFKKLNKLLLIVIPLLLISFLLFSNHDYNKDYAVSSNIMGRLNDVSDGGGMFLIRKNLSLQAIMMGLDYPILGVGRANFRLNTVPYADELREERDAIYRLMISELPHNTFAGIFAELGLLGLLAFSSLFLILLYGLLKRRNNMDLILLAGLIAFFVQSIVLCLENTRILWVYLAFSLKLQATDIKDVSLADVSIDDIHVKKYAVICLSLVILAFMYTSVRVTRFVSLDEPAKFNIPNSNGPVEIHYRLTSASRNLTEITIDGSEFVRYGHVGADGYGYFSIPENSELDISEVTFTSLTDNSSEIRSLYYVSDGKKTAMLDYKFLPGFFEKALNYFGLLKVDSYSYPDSEPIANYFSNDHFEILDISLEDGVTFEILFKKATTENTVVTLHYYNDNILSTPNSRNTITRRFNLRSLSAEWEEGQVYTYTDRLRTSEAVYKVDIMIDTETYSLGETELAYAHISDYLNDIDDDSIVIFSIREEATNALDYEALTALSDFGLEESLLGKNRHSYIAVASKMEGFVPYEELSNEPLEVDFLSGDMMGEYTLTFDLSIISIGGGDRLSSIIIDGEEYSQNKRGLNIVVYDTVLGTVKDAVCFDTTSTPFTHSLR